MARNGALPIIGQFESDPPPPLYRNWLISQLGIKEYSQYRHGLLNTLTFALCTRHSNVATQISQQGSNAQLKLHLQRHHYTTQNTSIIKKKPTQKPGPLNTYVTSDLLYNSEPADHLIVNITLIVNTTILVLEHPWLGFFSLFEINYWPYT